jgi:3-hydroxypropanoate dehydrogenase
MNSSLPVISDERLHTSDFVDRVFFSARSQNAWQAKDVPETKLRTIWDLLKWGPTSANCSPLRVIFVKSDHERELLSEMVSEGNFTKVKGAPVTAILGFDLAFYEELPRLFPHNPNVQDWFRGEKNKDHAYETAFRNGSLQAAYFMLAARTVGLDCGPMSGFDARRVDETFWSGTQVKTNFLCGLGYGDPSQLFPRHPRFDFDDVCSIR